MTQPVSFPPRRFHRHDQTLTLVGRARGVPLSRHPHRDDFTRALDRLSADGWRIVDAERFESAPKPQGCVSLPSDLAEHFGPDGAMVKDVALRWRDCVPSMLQSAFAREGIVLSVPGQGPEQDEDEDELSEEELASKTQAAIVALVAASSVTNPPEEGTVTCLATDRASDLCRITAAFDRLAEHGYIAEPALWVTTSGCWQRVHAQARDEQSCKAVFWNTQCHVDSFDARGDLVGELPVHWTGDPDLIGELLAGTGLDVRVPRSRATTFILRPIGYIASTDKVDVVLESAGHNQIQVIKALRQIVSGLGVSVAKELVEAAPKPILEQVSTWAAKVARKKLEAAGATITIKRSRSSVETQQS